jgi:hypothetical protein
MSAHVKRLQQVVNRSVHYAPAESAENPYLCVFLGLWDEARGDRAMPVYSDIPPAALQQYLDMLQLFDVAGGDFRIRVSGPRVFRVNGVDMTDKLVSEHPNAGVRERLSETLRRVNESRKPIYARFESLEDFPVYHRMVESVYAPLGAGAEPEQIIGFTVFSI